MTNPGSHEDNPAAPVKKPVAGGKSREADVIAALGKTRDSLVAEVAKVIVGGDGGGRGGGGNLQDTLVNLLLLKQTGVIDKQMTAAK